MACLVFTKCDPLQQLHIQNCTISGSMHLLPPPHPLWSIFCMQAISIVIFLFSFFGVLWILLSATAVLGQNSHISIPRCAHLVVFQAIFNKKVSIIGLSMHVRQAGMGMYSSSCHLLASSLQFRAQNQSSLSKNFGCTLSWPCASSQSGWDDEQEHRMPCWLLNPTWFF